MIDIHEEDFTLETDSGPLSGEAMFQVEEGWNEYGRTACAEIVWVKLGVRKFTRDEVLTIVFESDLAWHEERVATRYLECRSDYMEAAE